MGNLKRFTPLIFSLLIAHLAGMIGSFFTISSVGSWYLTLNVPTWNPPSWVFGPVWLTLYTLMGIAAYLIWRSKKSTMRKRALMVYGIQLILNALWSVLFFGLHNPGLAFAEILILLAMITATSVLFWRIDRRAGLLLSPYLAWVSFAMILNFTIWQLN